MNYELYCGIGCTLQEICGGLLQDLYGLGQKVYMDNYYNSIALTELLLSNQVQTCGMIRLNRGTLTDLRQQVANLHHG